MENQDQTPTDAPVADAPVSDAPVDSALIVEGNFSSGSYVNTVSTSTRTNDDPVADASVADTPVDSALDESVKSFEDKVDEKLERFDHFIRKITHFFNKEDATSKEDVAHFHTAMDHLLETVKDEDVKSIILNAKHTLEGLKYKAGLNIPVSNSVMHAK